MYINMNERSFNMKAENVTEKPDSAPTKRETAVAARREKILDAAVMCFLESGYHQTGVRDIAKRAGVSLGNLYNHFPGKHDMLVAIAALERTELKPFLDLLTKPAPALDLLDRFVTAYATYLAAPENIILTIEISSEAIRKPDIGTLFMANRHELAAALALVIERGVTGGELRADLDPDQAAQLIIELVDASAYRKVLNEVAMDKILAGLKDFVFAAVRND